MVTWEYPPRVVGGISRHCHGLAKALVQKNQEVHLITLEFPGAPSYEVDEGVYLHRVSIELGHPHFLTWTLLFNHFIEKRVGQIFQDYKPDIIHAHDWLVATSSISMKYYLKTPLVATIHSTEVGRAGGLHSPDSYTINGLEWWVTYEAKRVIVTSEAMRREVLDQFHLPQEKVNVIPNAIDLEKFNLEVDTDRVRSKYALPYEKVVLFVGRLTPQKGAEYLIRAAPMILERHPEAKIVIAGDGWLREDLETLAKRVDKTGKILFTGFLSDRELIEIMLCADVLVVPSVYEPFGIVALEGMAAGVPVVASEIDGLAEIVKNEKTGVTVYPRNSDSIAWGVNRVLSDPGYAKWLSKNAKEYVQKTYNWQITAEKTISLYHEAVSSL